MLDKNQAATCGNGKSRND